MIILFTFFEVSLIQKNDEILYKRNFKSENVILGNNLEKNIIFIMLLNKPTTEIPENIFKKFYKLRAKI